jgi:hypothetical protein
MTRISSGEEDLRRPNASNAAATGCSSNTVLLHNRNVAFRRLEMENILKELRVLRNLKVFGIINSCKGRSCHVKHAEFRTQYHL